MEILLAGYAFYGDCIAGITGNIKKGSWNNSFSAHIFRYSKKCILGGKHRALILIIPVINDKPV